MAYEIERKFLIDYPENFPEDIQEKKILQTYLLTDEGQMERVRKIEENGKIQYYHTLKKPVTMIRCVEEERKIGEEEYNTLLQRADSARVPIEKTRLVYPYDQHKIEIDLFPKWKHQAMLEVELGDESESFSLPSWVKVKREVTDEPAYKNAAMAIAFPEESSSL